VVLNISKARRTVSLLTVDTGVTVLKTFNDLLALKAFASHKFGILHDHTLIERVSGVLVLLHTLVLSAEAQSLLLSLMEDEFICKIVNQIDIHFLKGINVEVFDALMPVKLIARILLIANLA